MYQSSTLTTAGFSPLSNSQESTAHFCPLVSFSTAVQCGQYFTGLSVNRPGQVLLGHGALHGVMPDQAVRLQHQQIARGVGGLVDAILLGGIAGRGELHAGPSLMPSSSPTFTSIQAMA